MEEVKHLTSLEEIKAFSDPYRLQILTAYRKFNRPATVKEVADQLKETPAKIHYHVKKLEKVGILKLMFTKEINGIVAKYYEPTAERFVIRHKDHDKDLSKVISNESQRVISNLYDNSRKIVMNEMIKEERDTENTIEFVRSSDLYLTLEEAKEYNDFIKKLNRKHSENNSDGRKRYHMFSVLFPVED
jgi:DNA-binding transcriptional ArsR family regulator